MKTTLKDGIGKLLCTAAVAMTTLTLSWSAPALAEVESSDPIKLALNEWTGQHVSTKIAGTILGKMGYNVEYVAAGYYPQIQALRNGSLTATLEIWTSNIGDGYQKTLDTGDIEIIGDLGVKPREGWFYPAYMEEQCPGLPDWTALNDCAMLFAVPDTVPKGRFVDYPAEWGTTNKDRIDALGLNYQSIPAGSEGALIAEIKSAFATKSPLLVMFWEPHWVHSVYDMKLLQLPAYESGCYEDPAWGSNPDKTYDCDWDGTARADKVAWSGMKDKWPGAYRMLQAYTLSNKDQAEMMKDVDVDGRDLDEIVNEWIAANESAWQAWTQ